MRHLYKCQKCVKYTMKEVCSCGEHTLAARPLKYSPDDNLSSYRRQAKLPEYKKRGLI